MDHEDLVTTFRTLHLMAPRSASRESIILYEARNIVGAELAIRQWADEDTTRRPGESIEDMERRLLRRGGIEA
jgi:hypothetical protein